MAEFHSRSHIAYRIYRPHTRPTNSQPHCGELTGWGGIKQFQYLATKKLPEQEGLDQRDLEAQNFAESIVRDSCQMKVSHGLQNADVVMLGGMWDCPENKDADCAEGTFAAYLRYASVFLEQTRAMEAQEIGPQERKIRRVGVLEPVNESDI